MHHTGRVYQTLDERTGSVFGGVFGPADLAGLPDAWVTGLLSDHRRPRVRKPGRPSDHDKRLDRVAGELEGLQDWITQKDPCRAVSTTLEDTDRSWADGRYDTMIRGQLRLVRLGEQGHSGVAVALERLQGSYITQIGGDRPEEAGGEWSRGMSDLESTIFAGGLTAEQDRGCCTVQEREPDDNRLTLVITNLADFHDQMTVMVGAGDLDDVFVLGGQLTLVPTAGEAFWVSREEDDWTGEEAQLVAVGGTQLARVIDTRFWVGKRKEDKATGETMLVHSLCPSMDRVVSIPEFLRQVRRVSGVLHAPVVLEDGSLLQRRGYHETSGLLMLPTFQVPAVPETVTPEMAAEAMKHLMEPFAAFPFETDHDRANYLGALLTPALLRLLPPPWPLLCLNARQPGSGKTLLGTCIRALYGGTHRASLPADEEEIRKQITAVLSKTSGAVVMWDNIDRNAVLCSAQLSNLLTSREWSDRPLGVTADISVPNNRLWIVTGNNIQVGGDNPRRVLWSTIDPHVDHPERRVFPFNPATQIEEHRGDYMASVLTVIKGWVQAGTPQPSPTGGSYPEYQCGITGLLAFAGVPGTFMHQETDRAPVAADEDEWVAFYQALYQLFGTQEFSTTDAVSDIPSGRFGAAAAMNAYPSELTRKTGDVSATSLGRYFVRRNGRFIGGWVLRGRHDTDKNAMRWCVIPPPGHLTNP